MADIGLDNAAKPEIKPEIPAAVLIRNVSGGKEDLASALKNRFSTDSDKESAKGLLSKVNDILIDQKLTQNEASEILKSYASGSMSSTDLTSFLDSFVKGDIGKDTLLIASKGVSIPTQVPQGTNVPSQTQGAGTAGGATVAGAAAIATIGTGYTAQDTLDAMRLHVADRLEALKNTPTSVEYRKFEQLSDAINDTRVYIWQGEIKFPHVLEENNKILYEGIRDLHKPAKDWLKKIEKISVDNPALWKKALQKVRESQTKKMIIGEVVVGGGLVATYLMYRALSGRWQNATTPPSADNYPNTLEAPGTSRPPVSFRSNVSPGERSDSDSQEQKQENKAEQNKKELLDSYGPIYRDDTDNWDLFWGETVGGITFKTQGDLIEYCNTHFPDEVKKIK